MTVYDPRYVEELLAEISRLRIVCKAQDAELKRLRELERSLAALAASKTVVQPEREA